jgi:hypothetical protein
MFAAYPAVKPITSNERIKQMRVKKNFRKDAESLTEALARRGDAISIDLAATLLQHFGQYITDSAASQLLEEVCNSLIESSTMPAGVSPGLVIIGEQNFDPKSQTFIAGAPKRDSYDWSKHDWSSHIWN